MAGTSAGLAILGEYLYGALDGGSLRSPAALADPLGEATTIDTGFLHLKPLSGIVTDTHFSERNRLGRLLAFVAKAETLANGRTILGLGVDEASALALELRQLPQGRCRHDSRRAAGRMLHLRHRPRRSAPARRRGDGAL